MSDITFSGLATGMDTDSIVTQLMEIERIPIDRLEAKKTSEKERLDAFAQFETILDDLKESVGSMTLTSQVRTSEVKLSSEDAFSASASSAVSGSYDISVAQLSQVQKTISEGWSSQTDSLLGSGTFNVNGTDIIIDDTNNSLLGLASAINEISDTTGVKATIINDGSTGSPYHMVFTGVDSSSSFTLSSNLQDEDTNPIDFATTQAQTAQQAVVFIDGIKVVSDSNTIDKAINGITLNLNEVSKTSYAGTAEDGVDPWEWADPPVYISNQMRVEPDTDALKEKLTTFITTYNKAMNWINSGYDEFGGASTTTGEDGEEEELLGSVLRGDASINRVKRGLQSLLTNVVDTNGGFSILSQIGITTQMDGTLRQDNVKMDAALADNYDDVANLLSGKDDVDGVMKKFNYYLLDITSTSSGLYANKKHSYDQTIERLDDNISQMEPRMAKKELLLRAQFSAMEQLVSGLNSQGDFLTQQMDMLSNMVSGK
ncbi:MAG TPA: flagellar hook-associated protein 2 [Desulfobacterales bacterium]|nr:flagellar hook-associated protein 2 [Desulfobacterales bacterium]HIP38883.1 flagellar hook-associated protein 2 [Desulfocapsa sulfexigens]